MSDQARWIELQSGWGELTRTAYERMLTDALRPNPVLEAWHKEAEAAWLALPKRVRLWRTAKKRTRARIDDARFWLSQKVYPHECD